MTPSPPLAPGDELHCPHRHRWHRLVLRNNVTSTDYSNAMLFWQCVKGSGFYYAGQIGGTSRFPTRRQPPSLLKSLQEESRRDPSVINGAVMPKLGDTKPCIVSCGGVMEWKTVRPRDVHFVGPGDSFPQRIPDYEAWVCNECGFEQSESK